MKQRAGLKGFRTPARPKRKRKSDSMKKDSTAQILYARIPGHDLAQVVEMIYTYRGRRRKLKYILVTWPHIGPNIRRFEMTPFIKIMKRKPKAARWYNRIKRRVFTALIWVKGKLFNLFPNPPAPVFPPASVIQPHHLRHQHGDGEN